MKLTYIETYTHVNRANSDSILDSKTEAHNFLLLLLLNTDYTSLYRSYKLSLSHLDSSSSSVTILLGYSAAVSPRNLRSDS